MISTECEKNLDPAFCIIGSTRLYPATFFTTTFSTGTGLPITYAYSTDFEKQSDTTVKNSHPNNGLLKNNIVISLLGIFVFFFSLFVISYIYLKCFRKKINAGGIKDNKQHSQYNSLNFNQVEPESTVQLNPLRHMEADSTYLLPVFSPSESSEIEMKPECNKIKQYITNHGYEIGRRQQFNSTADNIHDHVYIEITENNIGNSNTTVDNVCRKQESVTHL